MKKGAKKWMGFDFDASITSSPVKTEVCAPNEDILFKIPKQNLRINFLQKLNPKTIEDLAVHPKKIIEVENWLNEYVLSSKQIPVPILLLVGPTGSGKTATVNVLCKVKNINLIEWVNPVDEDYEFGRSQAQLTKFLDFFTQTKYNSLLSDNACQSVTLVEDFPNFVTYNPEEFIKVLEHCQMGNTPVIFICTESSNNKLDLAQKLFPQATKEKFPISTINFNPCSATLLKTVLKRMHSLLQINSDLFRIPSVDVVDAIISSTMGDIRCAINQYQFACLKGTNKEIALITNTNLGQGAKRKRNGKQTCTIKSMVKDETLGFFHGLGRVLNPKRYIVNNSWRIQCEFDVLIDQFSTQPANFNSFLQENYLKYFGDLLDAQNAADTLSFAQLFLHKWIDHQEVLVYALWVAVLGLMVHNNNKVSKWNQIQGPKKIKKEADINLRNGIHRTDYLYYNLITKSDKFPTFK